MTTDAPTPECDAMCEREFESAAHTIAAWTDFARNLERQRNALRALIDDKERRWADEYNAHEATKRQLAAARAGGVK